MSNADASTDLVVLKSRLKPAPAALASFLGEPTIKTAATGAGAARAFSYDLERHRWFSFEADGAAICSS